MVNALLDTSSYSYAEIVRRPLDAQRCVLLVIDIQEKLRLFMKKSGWSATRSF